MCSAARQAIFGSVAGERCQFHLQQNAGQYVPKMAMRALVAADIRAIFNAPDQDEAEHLLQKFLDRYEETAPKLVAWAEEALPQGFTVFALPASHRRRLWKSSKTGRSLTSATSSSIMRKRSADNRNCRKNVAQFSVAQCRPKCSTLHG